MNRWQYLRKILLRGVHQRCPNCDEGSLFEKWNTVYDTCSVCGYEFERRAGDTWFFTYMSTAFLTGIILLIIFLFPPANHTLGRVAVVAAWFVMIVLTLPRRKAIAFALDYYFEHIPHQS